ncbi:MAG: phospholipase D-like domain-containing protein [Treponema sp.]|jgi:phosphatidylserine/phosphatidylglycerophosphate/cardiolipin synthase-like enzyme|nr:phospholipase D-like domain-containing protein [Treponema sp.]
MNYHSPKKDEGHKRKFHKSLKPLKTNIENATLYIGTNAGKIISDEINDAKQSIWIVSPYFYERQIDQLLKKYDENIDVRVISTDANNFRKTSQSGYLKKIILQERVVLEAKKRKYLFLKLVYIVYSTVYFASILTLLFLQLKGLSNILLDYKYIIGMLILLIPFIRERYKSIKIYTYNYVTKFPMHFVRKPFFVKRKIKVAGDIFVHAKLFIIDNYKAFIGSVNLSNSGFFHSCESCLTIKDKEAVKESCEFFDRLYNVGWELVDINKIGRQIYPEPVN